MTGPLTGVRVLDVTHVLAGPYATGQLALMGAEVIRIERPGDADFVRAHGGTEEMRSAGLGASFLSQNAGKSSVVLDLKQPEHLAKALDLAESADIFVENFRPGVAGRLGLGFEAVRARRPDVIYASLSGYGPDGPLAGRPAYDHIVQGLSGMMAMTGTPESGPMRVGFPVVDYVAGQALVAALLAALLQRARAPGEAQRLHVSMLEAITTLMGAYAIAHETAGTLRGLGGNRAFSDSPWSGRFDTADGQIVVTANTPAQAARLGEAMGLGALHGAGEAAIREALTAAFAAETTAHWDALLAEASVPAGPVVDLGAALAHPQMEASPAWLPLEVPQLGMTVRAPALPFRAPWAPTALAPAPQKGADTQRLMGAATEADAR